MSRFIEWADYIQLILAAAFIFILILLSLFVLPATKYSDLAMPLVIVLAILIPYSFFVVSEATLQGLERMKGLGSIIFARKVY